MKKSLYYIEITFF